MIFIYPVSVYAYINKDRESTVPARNILGASFLPNIGLRSINPVILISISENADILVINNPSILYSYPRAINSNICIVMSEMLDIIQFPATINTITIIKSFGTNVMVCS